MTLRELADMYRPAKREVMEGADPDLPPPTVRYLDGPKGFSVRRIPLSTDNSISGRGRDYATEQERVRTERDRMKRKP